MDSKDLPPLSVTDFLHDRYVAAVADAVAEFASHEADEDAITGGLGREVGRRGEHIFLGDKVWACRCHTKKLDGEAFVHKGCASVPRIGDQFRQCDLRIVRNPSKRADQIVLLEERARRCVRLLLRSSHGSNLTDRTHSSAAEMQPAARGGLLPATR